MDFPATVLKYNFIVDPRGQMVEKESGDQMTALVKVKTGMQVEIEFVDRAGLTEKLEFVIVPDKQADYAHGLLGESTPLAQALMGHAPGDEMPYPLDDIVSVRILDVRPGDSVSDADAASRREATYRKAVADIDKRNAVAFAASFSGKWGDYDPRAVEDWDQETKTEDKP
jgi:hypothetical protein